MIKNKYLLLAINIIALAVFTATTMVLVFMVYNLQNQEVFALAFIAILIALAAIWVIVLFRSKLHKKYGVPVVASATIVTIVYYVVVMVFTGLFAGLFKNFNPKIFMGIDAVIILGYFLIMVGLAHTAISKAKDIIRHDLEKAHTMEINLILMNIEESLKKEKMLISSPDYNRIQAAFKSFEERQKMSTPFGRSKKDEVRTLEKEILNCLQKALDYLNALKESPEKKQLSLSILLAFEDALNLVKNKERIIVQ